MYPASTTKIMTALLALEYGRLDEPFTVPKQIAKLPRDSSLVPLKRRARSFPCWIFCTADAAFGQRRGGGHCDACSPLVDEFVARMNQRASELGSEHALQKPTRLHAGRPLHHRPGSALITGRRCSPNFPPNRVHRSYTLPALSKNKKRKLTSTDEMILESSPNYYPYENRRQNRLPLQGRGIASSARPKRTARRSSRSRSRAAKRADGPTPGDFQRTASRNTKSTLQRT
jgi:hypothetical protein